MSVRIPAVASIIVRRPADPLRRGNCYVTGSKSIRRKTAFWPSPCLLEMRIPSPLFQGGFVGSGKRFRPTDRLLEGDAFGIVLKQRRQLRGDRLGAAIPC